MSSWDPGLTKIDDRWHVSFVESPSQDPFDFHPALAAGPADAAAWHDGLELVCDADLLKGAIWNLLRNAIECSPAGATVTVSAVAKGRSAVIEVLDRGPGIPADRRAAVFEPFRTDRPQGLGLGLPLALAAAQAHGGTIVVDEAPGGGACFRIVLPLVEM